MTQKQPRKREIAQRWSARVMKESDALDLEEGVFRKRSGRQIALSLRRSAEKSSRRKGSSFQSAMSMLNFYVNRAGKNLSRSRVRILNQAKEELRKIYEKDSARCAGASTRRPSG